MPLHPATRIGIWLLLAIGVQGLHSAGLAALSLLLLIVACRFHGFPLLLKRARWLFLSLLVIYAIATLGELLWPQVGAASPTVEGLREGALQAWRLLCLLAALAWFLAGTPRDALIGGLYRMLHPFFGNHAGRIAVRMALTLDYAEQAAGVENWKNAFNAEFDTTDTVSTISLRLEPFTWRDVVVLAGVA
ncbi:MAG TPA: CbiQ family ECF transporter T component [Burkholderiales bacterium]|nr:CbiQ family ECF transporter T component [Burkholderiales bacterium]